MKADFKTDDRRKNVALREPLLLGDAYRHRGAILDIAFDLTRKSAGFRRSLPARLLTALAGLLRSTNPIFEGHHTHPTDIEPAQERLQQRHP